MEIIVDGARIVLTAEQLEVIAKEKRRRKRCRNSFAKMQRHFGFKPQTGFKGCENSFTHPDRNWYAEILEETGGRAYSYVWMTGEGLKDSSGMCGGWTYSEPEEIEQEIVKAISLAN